MAVARVWISYLEQLGFSMLLLLAAVVPVISSVLLSRVLSNP